MNREVRAPSVSHLLCGENMSDGISRLYRTGHPKQTSSARAPDRSLSFPNLNEKSRETSRNKRRETCLDTYREQRSYDVDKDRTSIRWQKPRENPNLIDFDVEKENNWNKQP